MNKFNISIRQLSFALLVFLAVSTSYKHVECKDTFSSISESLFSNIKCLPSAYADFNADKRIDIYCISHSGKVIEIWLAQEKDPLFNKFKEFSLK